MMVWSTCGMVDGARSAVLCMTSCYIMWHHVTLENIFRQTMYRNLSKIGTPSKISPYLHFFECCCKGAFLAHIMPNKCCYVSKKHWRSSTGQEEGLTIEGKHNLLLLHKQVHDKRGIAEPLHAYINKTRLTITTLENMPILLFKVRGTCSWIKLVCQ